MLWRYQVEPWSRYSRSNIHTSSHVHLVYEEKVKTQRFQILTCKWGWGI